MIKKGSRPYQYLKNNTFLSIFQVIALGVVPLILYRYLLQTLGATQMGLWSLILSTTSISRFGEFGLSASALKFVAQYIARDDLQLASEVIQTATLSIGGALSLFALIAYPLTKMVIVWSVPQGELNLALLILPYSLISLVLTSLNGAIQSGIDGSQRIDLRSMSVIGGAVFYLILCFVLSPKYGLVGLAYAQILQSVLLILVNWCMLRRLLPTIPWFPYRWNKKLFREMVGYGVNFQVASLAGMFYEPTTMTLLGRFGGLEIVAYYQIAKKLITQVRALIVAANGVLVPVVAHSHERDPNQVKLIYTQSFQVMLFVALPAYTITLAFSPVISLILIGHAEMSFFISSFLLTFAWFNNTLSIPAYFVYVGLGELRWNTYSYVLIAIANAILGASLGYLWGPNGVILGWVIAQSIGGLIIIVSYHYKHQVDLSILHINQNIGLIIGCVLTISSALMIYFMFLINQNIIVVATILSAITVGVLFIPFWQHPLRSKLMHWILTK